MHVRPILLAPLLALALVACAHKPVATQTATPILQGDPAHPALARGWVDTKLYFGLGPLDHPEQGVSEADWRRFLDREVTPRFPDGQKSCSPAIPVARSKAGVREFVVRNGRERALG